jgi:asparagine synthase (glutamine-hydrolysing)
MAQKLFYSKALSYLPKLALKLFPFNSPKNIALFGYSNFLKFSAQHITNIFSEDEKLDFCTFKDCVSTQAYIQKLYQISSSPEPIDQLQQAYCQSWLVEDLLMKADKMSMAVSLELRVPFLDHKLVEWAAKLPLEWKVGAFKKGFTTKRILRSFAETRIPYEIITRPKQGFPVPAYEWLKDDLFEFARENLEAPHFKSWIHMEKLQSLLNDLKNGDSNSAHKVWNLIILSSWMKRWKH